MAKTLWERLRGIPEGGYEKLENPIEGRPITYDVVLASSDKNKEVPKKEKKTAIIKKVKDSGIEKGYFVREEKDFDKDIKKILEKSKKDGESFNHKYHEWVKNKITALFDTDTESYAVSFTKTWMEKNSVTEIGSISDDQWFELMKAMHVDNKNEAASFFKSVLSEDQRSKYNTTTMLKMTENLTAKEAGEWLADKNRFGYNYVGPIGRFVLRNVTARLKKRTDLEVNSACVKEWIANRISQQFQFEGQKLELIRIEGSTHWSLASKFVRENQGKEYTAAERKGFFDFLKRENQPVYMENGFVVSETKQGSDNASLSSSSSSLTSVASEITDFGPALAVMLLLGDYDTFGSAGGNKGLVGDTFHVIDPGNAFKSMTGSVHDDFTTSGDKKKFKNFSAFQDQSLSHRMAGMILINKMMGQPTPTWLVNLDSSCISEDEKPFWIGIKAKLEKIIPDSDKKMFQEAIVAANQLGTEGEKLVAEIEAIQADYVARRTAMHKSFEHRLKLNPIELDLLDKIEKQLSKTKREVEVKPGFFKRIFSGKKDATVIKLQHGIVTKRVPCELAKEDNGTYKLTISIKGAKTQELEDKIANIKKETGAQDFFMDDKYTFTFNNLEQLRLASTVLQTPPSSPRSVSTALSISELPETRMPSISLGTGGNPPPSMLPQHGLSHNNSSSASSRSNLIGADVTPDNTRPSPKDANQPGSRRS